MFCIVPFGISVDGDCCPGLFLCGLALLGNERWENIMTGDADLLRYKFCTPQKIRECIIGSQSSLKELFSTSIDESCSPEDDADSKAESSGQKMSVNDQRDQSTFNQKRTAEQNPVPVDQCNGGKVDKEKRRMNALADCKSANHEGFWMSSCEEAVEAFEKRMDQLRSDDAKQRLMIIQSLRSSPSKMLSVDELTDAIGIQSYNKAYTFRKHLKRSFLTGKNALPAYIKDPPKGTAPSMKRDLTIVILKECSEICAFEKATKKQQETELKYSRHEVQPNFPEMKETFKLFEDEKSKLIGKSLLKSAGFADSHLRRHLNFSKDSLGRAVKKVSEAKSALQGMWKTAFDMVRCRYPERPDKCLFRKAKLVLKKKLGATKLLSRERSQLAHRPRKDIDPNILETIVEVSATSSDSGNLTHAKRHYDVKYIASVRESVDSNKKLSAGRLREQYNAIAQQFGLPTASVSTLKRRCIAPHSGHKKQQKLQQ